MPTSISGSDFSPGGADSERRWWFSSTWLECAVTHVFLPEAQHCEPSTSMDDYLLIRSVRAVARAHSEVIDDTLKPQWRCIAKMPGDLGTSIELQVILPDSYIVISQLCEMQTGGTFLISLQTLC